MPIYYTKWCITVKDLKKREKSVVSSYYLDEIKNSLIRTFEKINNESGSNFGIVDVSQIFLLNDRLPHQYTFYFDLSSSSDKGYPPSMFQIENKIGL